MPSDFRRRIAGVLGSVLGLGSLGCDLRRGMEDDLCIEGKHSFVQGLNSEEPFDYLAYRVMTQPAEVIQVFEEEYRSPDSDEGEQLSEDERLDLFSMLTIEELGQCTPNLSCAPELVPAGDLTSSPTRGYGHYLVEQGGEVRLLTSREEYLDFVGVIDKPQEAANLLAFDGYSFPCTGPNYKERNGGYLLYAERYERCPSKHSAHRIFVSANGEVKVRQSRVIERNGSCLVVGRLPQGEVRTTTQSRVEQHPVGTLFQRVAALEAASIVAFEDLARELTRHGAPRELAEWAARAADEERRHARLCHALARKYGASPTRPAVQLATAQSLLEIALDNAVEGLTREAFGALVAHHQMMRATDPDVAAAMSIIANDEAGHAEFSLALHRWLMTKLSDEEQRLVLRAQHDAQMRFSREAHQEFSLEEQDLAGLPSAEVSRQLFEGLFAAA